MSPILTPEFLYDKDQCPHLNFCLGASYHVAIGLCFIVIEPYNPSSSIYSRAAVVRGKVVTSDGMGLIGVRVSTTLPHEGFTMTRDDGWFDLMVNGGGPVMLQFGRNPYPPLR